MRIAVVNCNVNAAITTNLESIAAAAVSPGVEILALTPPFGPESAEGYYESFISAAGMLAALEQAQEEFDAVVLAGFGEHGREGARQRWEVPVVDITEAGPILAKLVSHRYGIVTTLDTTVPAIWESLRNAGLAEHCVGVAASGIEVSAIHDDAAQVASTLEREARGLQSSGAEAIVLGCAGFTGLDDALEERLGIPVIDGVEAACRVAELLVRSGLRTSAAGAFRPPRLEKQWVGWQMGSR
ncbi:aspartate/glutamate racemase family protein [Nesterenkonia populi]|uniref:aspartate/glutamate racemase family protein n=1 Tax=Nesterenkonia populi TaxID=1591087 RepID=UPI0011BD9B22|nr:aspartate/glutamate racemase family protein [Nesterenkonia populi]